MKNLEKYYRKFPFELICLTCFVFLHKNLKNPIRYNLKKEKIGFVAWWSSALDHRKWVQCNVFQTLYKVSSISFTRNWKSVGDFPSRRILAQAKAKRLQLNPSVCFSTGRNVTLSFPFSNNGWYNDFRHCLETDVRLVRRLWHTWTLPLHFECQ